MQRAQYQDDRERQGEKAHQAAYQRRKAKKEHNERNQIEGRFGQAKQAYGLNNIKAKLADTSYAWIGAVIFVTNLVKFAQLNNFQFWFPLFWGSPN